MIVLHFSSTLLTTFGILRSVFKWRGTAAVGCLVFFRWRATPLELVILGDNIDTSCIGAAIFFIVAHFRCCRRYILLRWTLASIISTTIRSMSATATHKRWRIVSVYLSVVCHFHRNRRHIRWIEIINGTERGRKIKIHFSSSFFVLYSSCVC